MKIFQSQGPNYFAKNYEYIALFKNVHIDIKLENVIFDSNLIAKIIDFAGSV